MGQNVYVTVRSQEGITRKLMERLAGFNKWGVCMDDPKFVAGPMRSVTVKELFMQNGKWCVGDITNGGELVWFHEESEAKKHVHRVYSEKGQEGNNYIGARRTPVPPLDNPRVPESSATSGKETMCAKFKSCKVTSQTLEEPEVEITHCCYY